MSYDFSEPLIRDLVERNHVPEEVITRVDADGVAVGSVVCEACGEDWPCTTLTALRTWLAQNSDRGLPPQAVTPSKR